jgi:16S rRNA (guanine966-N2)-methyltransferase|tara:strand:- start:935 stop:1495 length:561 start_codon:yes stop_codon:yes gene_type:complete
MRIISGKLKGKSINFLKNSTTRPLKDSVKENIFNILKHSNLINTKIEGKNILDLYSGIGSFGLECLSREAKIVKFIEEDEKALKILKENLIKLSIADRAILINGKIEDNLTKDKNKKYNIFFLDPPFSDTMFINNLNLIKENRMYQKNHVVIIHRERGSKDNLEDIIVTILTKKYGRSKIIFGTFI